MRGACTETLELVYMKDEAGAVFQVVQFLDKLVISVSSEVCIFTHTLYMYMYMYT